MYKVDVFVVNESIFTRNCKTSTKFQGVLKVESSDVLKIFIKVKFTAMLIFLFLIKEDHLFLFSSSIGATPEFLRLP